MRLEAEKKESKERLKIQKVMSMFFFLDEENGFVISPQCVKIQMVLEFNVRQIVVIPHSSIVVLVHGDLENISEKHLRQEGSSRGAYYAPVLEGNG